MLYSASNSFLLSLLISAVTSLFFSLTGATSIYSIASLLFLHFLSSSTRMLVICLILLFPTVTSFVIYLNSQYFSSAVLSLSTLNNRSNLQPILTLNPSATSLSVKSLSTWYLFTVHPALFLVFFVCVSMTADKKHD